MPRLILFPGLGADERAYAPQASLSVPFDVVRWPAPLSQRETLAGYARRIATGIDDRGGVYLGGYSLGAMVALEAARHLDARGIILIGGCTSHRQISALFRAVLVIGPMLPASWLRATLRLSPLAFRVFEKLDAGQSAWMGRLLREHDIEQTRWSARAIMGWRLTAAPAAPVWAIHGERDEVIPLRGVRPDAVVPGGRHLIHVAHAAAVNAFVEERVRRGAGARGSGDYDGAKRASPRVSQELR